MTNSPTQRVCDCRCPIHHGYRRTTYNTTGCACAITCPTQPMTVLALVDPWNCALFTHPGTGCLRFVMPLGKDQWDWESANEIDSRSEYFAAGQAIEPLIHAIAAAVAATDKTL